MSVVAAPVANAAASDLSIAANGATSTTSRGIISTNGAAGTSALADAVTTTNVGVMLSNGSAYVTVEAGAATTGFGVSGGAISSPTCADASAVTLNAARTTASCGAATNLTLTVSPNSGVASMTLTSYTTSAFAVATGAITYAIVTAASTNVFSASTSFLSVETSGTTATDNTDAVRTSVTNTDATNYAATEVPAGSDGFFGYDLKDAYGTALSAHVIGASVTGPCLVGFNQAHTSNTYTSASTSTAAGYISVGRVTSTAPGVCTLTVTDNGTTIATRTFKFLGQVEKLTITNVLRVKSGSTANDDAIEVEAFDSAGNRLDNISWSATSASLGSSLTTVAKDRNTDRLGLLSDGDITCLNAGTYDLAVQATNASLATITSPTVKINCAGDPLSFTASLDKAIYAPGDIATLTITAKDSAGNLTNDYAVVGTDGAASTAATLTGGQMTIIGQTTSALLNAITFTDGVAKFKFTVGTTEGSYNMVVDLPKWPNAAGANQAQTVAYSIKNPSTTVTNAEVLASIVKLIASINKQIKALQKSLRR
jgi:hypothetical protein